MTPEFSITHHQTREDGGGELQVIASTPESKIKLCNHFELTAEEMVAALSTSDPLVYRRASQQTRDNYAFFLCEVKVHRDYVAPYMRLLERRVGELRQGRLLTPGEPFDIPSDFMYPRWNNLVCYTRFLVDAYISEGELRLKGIVECCDWNNISAKDNAAPRLMERAETELGHYVHEPEYLPCSNGLFRPNPRYGRAPLRRRPAAESQWFMNILVDYWLENYATPKQRELVATSHALNHANHKGVSDLHCNRFNDHGLRVSWNEDVIPWKTFAEL